jgi:hypothetical protein
MTAGAVPAADVVAQGPGRMPDAIIGSHTSLQARANPGSGQAGGAPGVVAEEGHRLGGQVRGGRVGEQARHVGPSEPGFEIVDLTHAVLNLRVGRVLTDAAHGPAQNLRAATRDAGGD